MGTLKRLSVVFAVVVCLLAVLAIRAEAQMGEWQQLATLPAATLTAGGNTAVIGTQLYVVGAAPRALYVYDSVANTWSTLSAPPLDTALGMVAGDGSSKIYVAGGCVNACTQTSNQLEIFDTATGTWSVSSSSMNTSRLGPAGAFVNGKLYVVGGTSGPSGGYAAEYTSMEVYDSQTGNWTTSAAQLPVAREEAGSAAINGKLYVVGGFVRTSSAGAGNNTGELDVYDTIAGTWATLAAMPVAVQQPAVAVLNGQLHVLGGDASGVAHQVYDPGTDTWFILAPLPALKQSSVSAGSIGSMLYMAGGSSSLTGTTADLFAFIPPGSPNQVPGLGPIDVSDTHFVSASTSGDSVLAATALTGQDNWSFSMFNHAGENPSDSNTTFTNPAMSVQSNIGPFIGDLYPQNAAGAQINFPFNVTQQDLLPSPNGNLRQDFTNTSVTRSFTPGFDSSRSVSPTVIPPGGANQTVTITVNVVDPRYTLNSATGVTGAYVGVNLGGDIQSASGSDPAISSSITPGQGVAWSLNNPTLNTPYTFTAVIFVPNAGSLPILTSEPALSVEAGIFHLPWGVVGPSVTIVDPLLGTSGAVVFSVDQATADFHPRTPDETFAVLYNQVYIASTPANNPPAFIFPTPGNNSSFNTHVGGTVTFTVQASDPDAGDTVTLTSSVLPPGATFAPASGPVSAASNFSYTPIPAAAGSNVPFFFTATDSHGAQTTIQVNVSVAADNPPQFNPPTQSTGTTFYANVGAALSLTVQASDPDPGDMVTLSLSTLANTTLTASAGNMVQGTFTFTPASNQVGPNLITITATDLSGAQTSITYTVVVTTVPTFSYAPASPGTRICSPVIGIEGTREDQNWYLQADASGTLTVQLFSHGDPGGVGNVRGTVFDAQNNVVAQILVPFSYPATPSGTMTIASTPGAVYRMEVGLDSGATSEHYHFELQGAIEGVTRGIIENLEPVRPVSWAVNVAPGEALSVDVPLPEEDGGPGATQTTQAKLKVIDPNGQVRFVDTDFVTLPRTISVADSGNTPGQWVFEIVDLTCAEGPDNCAPHYELNKTSGPDRGIYLTWFTSGTGTVDASLTLNQQTANLKGINLTFTDTLTGQSYNFGMNSATNTIPNLAAGPYTVTATAPQGAVYNVSPNTTSFALCCNADVHLAFDVTLIAPTLNVSLSPNSGSTYGTNQSVDLSLTGINGGQAPGGSYSIQVDNGPVVQTPVNVNGPSSFGLGSLSVGAHSVQVNYGGDNNYLPATAPPFNLTVNKANPLFQVNPPQPTTYGMPSGIIVTFQTSGNQVPPSGSVSYQVDGGPVQTVPVNANPAVASLQFGVLGAGTHNVIWTYSGDGNFNSSGSQSTQVSVTKSTPQVSLNTSPTTYGSHSLITITVSSNFNGANAPSGNVTYSVDGGPSFGGNLSVNPGNGTQGVFTLDAGALPAGSHFVNVTYNGDNNYINAPGPLFDFTVNRANPQFQVNTPPSYPVWANERSSVTFQTSGNQVPPTGSINYQIDGGVIQTAPITANPTSATLQLGLLNAGTHNVIWTYTGDNNFNSASGQPITVTVNKSTPQVGISASPVTYPAPYSFTVTVSSQFAGSAAPFGSITYSFDGGAQLSANLSVNPGNTTQGVVTVNAGVLNGGGHTLNVSYNGNTNYNPTSSTPQPFAVNKASSSTLVNSLSNPSTFGTPVTFRASVNGQSGGALPTGSVSFTIDGTFVGSPSLINGQATFTANGLNGGTHNVQVSYSGDANYLGSGGNTGQTVSPVTSSVSLNSSSNPSTSGNNVTFTAQVNSPIGPPTVGSITFKDNGNSLGTQGVSPTGQATFTTNALSVGNHSITASYTDGTNFSPSTSSTVAQVVNAPAPPVAPPFSQIFPAPDGACICSPLLQNSNVTGTQNWYVKAGTSMTLTVFAHAINSTDPENVRARIFDSNGVQIGNDTVASYPGGTPAETEVSATATVATTQDAIYRVEIATPNTPGSQPDYRLKFEGVQEVGSGTPTSPSFEGFGNGADATTWLFNAAANEQIQVGVFTNGNGAVVPPPMANQVTLEVVDTSAPGVPVPLVDGANNPLGTALTLNNGDGNTSGVNQVFKIAPDYAAGATTPRIYALVIQQADGHYKLNRGPNDSDRGVYMGWVTNGEGTINLSVVNGDLPFPGTIQISAYNTLIGPSDTNTLSLSAGSVSFKGDIGSYHVALTARAGYTVTPSQLDFTLTCDGTANLSFLVKAVPTVTLAAGEAFTYDGTPHSAVATATGAGGAVIGTFSYSYTPGGSAPPVNANTYSVTATFMSSDPNYLNASATGTVTINPAPASVTPNAASKPFGSSDPTLTGTLTGFLAADHVTATYSRTPGEAVAGSPYTISATLSGPLSNYSITYNTAAFTIVSLQTSTALVSNLTASVFGQPVTLTATTTSTSGTPSGTITFMDGSTALATVAMTSGKANFTTSALSAGSHAITAVYTSNNNFNGSTSSALTEAVNQASTSGSLTSSLGTSATGSTVTFTSTITAVTPGGGVPTGTVTFADGTAVLGTGTLNGSGQATFSTSALSVGVHSITATYAGDSNFKSNTSTAVSELVYAYPAGASGGDFVIGDLNSALGTQVTFWGAQWAKSNSFSGGSAPSSFKGFADSRSGNSFAGDTGNSNEPASVQSYIAVIVSSAVNQSGSAISGTVARMVVIKTNSGYAANPGHAGTGTVVAIIP